MVEFVDSDLYFVQDKNNFINQFRILIPGYQRCVKSGSSIHLMKIKRVSHEYLSISGDKRYAAQAMPLISSDKDFFFICC